VVKYSDFSLVDNLISPSGYHVSAGGQGWGFGLAKAAVWQGLKNCGRWLERISF
jgi:hypothetical protein